MNKRQQSITASLTNSTLCSRLNVRSPSCLLRLRRIFTESRSANLAVPSYHTNTTVSCQHYCFHSRLKLTLTTLLPTLTTSWSNCVVVDYNYSVTAATNDEEEEEGSHRQQGPLHGSSSPYGALSQRGLLDPIKLAYVWPTSAGWPAQINSQRL